MKTWLTDIFGTEKVAIGLVHLKALPSDPMYDFEGGMDKVIASAKHDIIALQNGGIDGLMFSNEFSFPYQKKVSQEVLASMAYVIGSLKPLIKVPFGSNVISDPDASIALNAAVGGQYTRGGFSGCFSSNAGIVNEDVGAHMRHRANLRMNNFKIIQYVLPESSRDLGGRTIHETVKTANFENMVDAFGVSGSIAGQKIDLNILKEIKETAPDQVVFATTGLTLESIEEIYSLVDGAFVATYFKENGVFENPVDENRVKKFMDKLKAFRTEN